MPISLPAFDIFVDIEIVQSAMVGEPYNRTSFPLVVAPSTHPCGS
jgi:hypothetical protein